MQQGHGLEARLSKLNGEGHLNSRFTAGFIEFQAHGFETRANPVLGDPPRSQVYSLSLPGLLATLKPSTRNTTNSRTNPVNLQLRTRDLKPYA